MAQLGLYIPQDAPWAADFIAELLQFPAGKHDDQVDALGLVGQLLDHIDAGFKPKSKEPDHRRGPVYVAGPDGRVTANIDLLKHLEAKRRKREEV